jgi:hypothetical protein
MGITRRSEHTKVALNMNFIYQATTGDQYTLPFCVFTSQVSNPLSNDNAHFKSRNLRSIKSWQLLLWMIIICA